MSDAQAGDARPFSALRREGYRVASGLYRVGTSVPAWDSRDSLTLSSGARLRRIRSFEAGRVEYALCVDVETLRTVVVEESDLRRGSTEETEKRGDGETGKDIISGSPVPPLFGSGGEGRGESLYDKTLRRYASAPMTAAGEAGVALTVDLCPSHRRWDRDLFEALRGMRGDQPLPVAICVSGAWVRHHEREFEQLCAWNRQGELDLTFVNHSDTHPVGAHGAFLNSGGVDFEAEILNAEVTLLARGVIPSPFFRFPGLAHSAARLKALEKYGLIPVDADEWPGQNHTVTDRLPEGILLLHGNGNERAGVKWFLEMVRRTGLKEKLRDGTRRMLSLAECARGG